MEPSGHDSTSWDPAYVAAGNWQTVIPKASRKRHWPNTTFTDYAPLVSHLHSDYDQIAQSILPLATYTALREEEPSEAARAYPQSLLSNQYNTAPTTQQYTVCALWQR